MAKLTNREVDALVETIIEQVTQNNMTAPDMVKYKKNCELVKELNEEINQRYKEFHKQLEKEMKTRISKSQVVCSNYNGRVSVNNPEKPKSLIDRKTIERDLLVANIKGDVEETIEKLVNKYTVK